VEGRVGGGGGVPICLIYGNTPKTMAAMGNDWWFFGCVGFNQNMSDTDFFEKKASLLRRQTYSNIKRVKSRQF